MTSTLTVNGPESDVSEACEGILRSLPEWFGIESAIQDYVRDTQRFPTFVLRIQGRVEAFVTLRQHFERSWEIHCIAVRSSNRGKGYGRTLLEHAEQWAYRLGARWMQVKTIAPSASSTHYAETRAFYARMGYEPLQEFPTLWAPGNPCLLLAKPLSPAAEASSRVLPDGTAALPADAPSRNGLPIRLLPATTDDIPALAEMNARLVCDQGSKSPYTIAEYGERFRDWLAGTEWCVDLFVDRTHTVGYAVHAISTDHYDPDTEVVYLRQFYIEREVRRRGCGRAAFAAFDQQRAVGREISLDVVATNPAGYAFWQSLGFKPYFTQMKRLYGPG